MKKRLFSLIIAVVLTFTGCVQPAEKEIVEPQRQNTDRFYLAGEYSAIGNGDVYRVKADEDDYLLAFYGRKQGENKEDNRVIYINKYNNIHREYSVPQETGGYDYRFFFTSDYALAYNVNDFGLDSDGKPHGFRVFDKDGNEITRYDKKHDEIIGYENEDTFTQLNLFCFGDMSVKDSETLIVSSHVAIYEYNLKKDSFKKLIGIEEIMEEGVNRELNDDFRRILLSSQGINKIYFSEKQGVVFRVNEDIYGDKSTIYSLKNGKLTPLTEKNGHKGVFYYNSETDCLITGINWDYTINGKTAAQYNMPVNYQEAFYPMLYAVEETAEDKVTVKYFDSSNMKEYETVVKAADATGQGGFCNVLGGGYENYLYMINWNDDIYRIDLETDKGEFVNGSVSDLPFCKGYRMSNVRVTEEDFMRLIQIYRDEIK